MLFVSPFFVINISTRIQKETSSDFSPLREATQYSSWPTKQNACIPLHATNNGDRKKIIGGVNSKEKIKSHHNDILQSHKLRQKSYNHINCAEKVHKQYKMLRHFFKKNNNSSSKVDLYMIHGKIKKDKNLFTIKHSR